MAAGSSSSPSISMTTSSPLFSPAYRSSPTTRGSVAPTSSRTSATCGISSSGWLRKSGPSFTCSIPSRGSSTTSSSPSPPEAPTPPRSSQRFMMLDPRSAKSYIMMQQRDQLSSVSTPAPAASRVYYGGEHMEHFRRAVQGMDMHLRQCLQGLAAFPEGAVIKKRLLIHWWMGEGFVDCIDTGKIRFQQLVDMRFVSAVLQGHCVTAHACTVHPWIRRTLVAVARGSAFLDADPDDVSENDFSWARRACLRDGGAVSPAPFKFHPEICTIYNVDQKYIKLSDAWFSNKARLVTLQLGQWRASGASEQVADPKRIHIELIAIEHLIRGIGACKSLRYLSLRGTSRINAIPDAIGKLADLVVLDLRACHDLQALTKEVKRLHLLQYLDVSECYLLVDMPEGLGELPQLEVLKGFVLASSSRRNACSLSELAGLRKLRKLSISIGKKLKRAEVELSVLSNLTNLTSLKITWGMVSSKDGKEQPSNATTPPDAFSLPSTLTKLELCCFPCQEFVELLHLDGLQNLKKLYVTGGMLRNLVLARSENGECRVEVLRLRSLNHLNCSWEELHRLYRRLRFVEAQRCPATDIWRLNDRGFWRKSDEASQQQTGPGGVSPEIVRDASN